MRVSQMVGFPGFTEMCEYGRLIFRNSDYSQPKANSGLTALIDRLGLYTAWSGPLRTAIIDIIAIQLLSILRLGQPESVTSGQILHGLTK